jgi:diguanylate cyclase (GGDEF)-like protein
MRSVSSEADSSNMQDPAEIRTQAARLLLQRTSAIVRGSVAVFPFGAGEGIDAGFSTTLAEAILQLLTDATLSGHIHAQAGTVGELRQLVSDKGVSIRQLFELVYIIERAALDELALDESFGATSDQWPAFAQIVRRASYDVLSAFSTNLTLEPADSAVVDPLTTLLTRGVFVAVLEKEIQRSERFGHPFALILLDVDRLADLNAKHGYGAGDRVLERIGIIVRSYFREQDWVARCAGDSFAVLLPETIRSNAQQLADRVCVMVAERLELHDYRTEEPIPVTVSVGVLIAESVDKNVRAEQLLDITKQAVDRAKNGGRNRVERVEITATRSPTPVRDTPLMD